MAEKSLLSTGVFERTGSNTLSERTYFFCLSLFLIWGLGSTAFIAKLCMQVQMGVFAFLFLGLVLPIIGIFMAIKSNNWIISFIGYNFICLPYGVILGPAVNQYEPGLIYNAFLTTMMITLIMGSSGVLFPQFYRHIGGALFIALVGLLIVLILQMFMGFQMGIIAYIAAGLFSLYIGYDMHRAMNVPRNLDSAVDISVELYLDIINLFLWILRIMGNK